MTVPVAVAQFAAGLDKGENLNAVSEAITTAAEAGAQLVVTPEYGMYHDPKGVGDPGYAEALDGPFLTGVRETARAAGVTAVVGMAEAVDGDARAYNTLATVGPDGELIGCTARSTCNDAFGYAESDKVIPAAITERSPSISVTSVRAMTCYDLRFPETARTLVERRGDRDRHPAAGRWGRPRRITDHADPGEGDREHLFRARCGPDRPALRRAEHDRRSDGHGAGLGW